MRRRKKVHGPARPCQDPTCPRPTTTDARTLRTHTTPVARCSGQLEVGRGASLRRGAAWEGRGSSAPLLCCCLRLLLLPSALCSPHLLARCPPPSLSATDRLREKEGEGRRGGDPRVSQCLCELGHWSAAHQSDCSGHLHLVRVRGIASLGYLDSASVPPPRRGIPSFLPSPPLPSPPLAHPFLSPPGPFIDRQSRLLVPSPPPLTFSLSRVSPRLASPHSFSSSTDTRRHPWPARIRALCRKRGLGRSARVSAIARAALGRPSPSRSVVERHLVDPIPPLALLPSWPKLHFSLCWASPLVAPILKLLPNDVFAQTTVVFFFLIFLD